MIRVRLPLSSLLICIACSSDGPSAVTSRELSDVDVGTLARAVSGWTYFRNSPDTLARSNVSGHSEARLRTRYNAIAATQLDSVGRVKSGAVFPDSSVIVKELYDGNVLRRYAVMMKRASKNAGAGWLWGEYAPDGSTFVPITNRGNSCVNCHSVGIDYSRMNDGHP